MTEKDEEAALETLSVPPGINKSSDWPLVSVTSLKKNGGEVKKEASPLNDEFSGEKKTVKQRFGLVANFEAHFASLKKKNCLK